MCPVGNQILPLGKLDNRMLTGLLRATSADKSVLVGPGIGRDAAIVRARSVQLALTTDPITLCSSHVPYHLVHINANDIACTGAMPEWLLVNLLLPPGVTRKYVELFFEELSYACSEVQVTLVGGHTEVTDAVNRPTATGFMAGVMSREKILSPADVEPGDSVLLTKGLAVEGSYLLYNAHRKELASKLGSSTRDCLDRYLQVPGISVLPEARVAAADSGTRCLHDLTDGGLVAGLWEIAAAGNVGVRVRYCDIPVLKETTMLCGHYGLDPLRLLASGALLVVMRGDNTANLDRRMANSGVLCRRIGEITGNTGEVVLVKDKQTYLLPQVAQDELLHLPCAKERGDSLC